MENEFLNRVKLLSVYDTKKTLNENREDIFEQQTPEQIYNNYLIIFNNSVTGINKSMNVRNMIDILKSIPDRPTFDKFFNDYKKNYGVTISTHINQRFGPNDHQVINEIASIIETRFMYVIQSGIKYYNRSIGKWEFLSSSRDYPKILNMNPQFDKKFKISGDNRPSRDTIFPTQQPEQQPTQQQRVVPQTFNDLLQGKGFLKFGDKSPAVKELQEKLISIDYTVISRATGYFGNETRTAVQYFQNNSNLKPDLIVGKNTALALNNAVQLRQRRNQQQTQPIPSVQRGVPQSNIQAPTTGIKR
jgi:hypothetical protein